MRKSSKQDTKFRGETSQTTRKPRSGNNKVATNVTPSKRSDIERKRWHADWTPGSNFVPEALVPNNATSPSDLSETPSPFNSKTKSQKTPATRHNGKEVVIRNVGAVITDSPDSSEVLKRILPPKTPGGRGFHAWSDTSDEEFANASHMRHQSQTPSSCSDESGTDKLVEELRACESLFKHRHEKLSANHQRTDTPPCRCPQAKKVPTKSA